MILVFYTVAGLLLLGFVFFLFHKLGEDKKLGRRPYDFGDGNLIVYAVLLLIGSVVFVNLRGEPEFSTPEELLASGEETHRPWVVSAACMAIVQRDTENLDAHFKLITAHFENRRELPDKPTYKKERQFILAYYNALARSWDDRRTDIGNMFLGMYHDELYGSGEPYLQRVQDTTLKYLNLLLSRDCHNHEREKSEAYFRKEINGKGAVEIAYPELAESYYYSERYDSLSALIAEPGAKEFIPAWILRKHYLRNGSFGESFLLEVKQALSGTDTVGFFAALLILLTWFVYLLRVNVYRSRRWLLPLLFVLFAAAFSLPVWLLYDFYSSQLDFSLNGEPGNDLLYCIFGIGVIEELVKIVPFLLLLGLTRVVKTPVDYIMYASLSALGFAVLENFIYFRDGNTDIILGRALTASISHLVDSSIIAYGLVLAKFRYKKSRWLFFFPFFLLAAISHGLYDFFLFNKTTLEYWYATFLPLLLVSILVYASFINNALNNSSSPQPAKLNASRLGGDLAGMLTGIFILQYLCTSLVYGPETGNDQLVLSMLYGGYMILFLSIRLSNIDIFPGDWARIDFFVGLLPSHIIHSGKKQDHGAALGTRVRLRVFRKYGKLDDVLPADGVIVKRAKISGDTGWLLVKLDKPMPWAKLDNDHVLIRAKNSGERIGTAESVIVHFTLIPDVALLEKKGKKEEDFRFMDWAVVEKQD